MQEMQPTTGALRDPIRVVIVDDSPTVRNLLVSILQAAEGIQVVGTAADGEEAVRLVRRMRPDVATMDVRMPKMDGLEATRRIMREAPIPIIIISSSELKSDVDLTLEALKAGAVTVAAKPTLVDPEASAVLVKTVQLMAGVPVVHHWGRATGQTPGMEPAVLRGSGPIERRSPKIIGIAASTGGPAALATVLGSLPSGFPVPILIVQHITHGFASGMAEWLASQTPLRVGLASHGEPVVPGTALLAPDDYHLLVNKQGAIELTKEEPYRGLRPSANYLFASMGQLHGPGAVGVILTGMGDDGVEGLQTLRLKGGLSIAQDEESCIVYGMPREATVRHAVDRVLPLTQIALALRQLADCDGKDEL